MVRSFFAAQAAVILVLAVSMLVAACASDDRHPGAVCSPACSGFQMCCASATGGGSSCANTGVDPMNCGSCGVRCAAGESCRSGACMRTGDAGLPPPPTDGSVPRVDSGPPGMCMPTCSSTQRCCGTTCINKTVAPGTDGRTDPSFMNCNGCGIACDATRANACTTPVGMAGGTPGCRCGNFPSCTAGAQCAMGATGTFQCVNTMTDPANCGMIGHACASGETCSMGMCVCPGTGAACPMGQGCCGGRCVDTTGDEANCGMCGRMCPAGTTCTMGACLCGTEECAAPAGMALGELCCGGACVAQDAMNCGGCGMACADGETCANVMDLFTMTTRVCCSMPPPFPGFPAICSGFGGGLDGGLPIP